MTREVTEREICALDVLPASKNFPIGNFEKIFAQDSFFVWMLPKRLG